jgi:serine/threonine protein kinase
MAKKVYPANKLLNVTLNDGWFVESKVVELTTTSGKYSTCYIVSKNGHKGFLKAFDYRDLAKPGGRDVFDRLNAKFGRERDILKKCKKLEIATVVEFITSDEYYFVEGDLNEKVDYFITEYSRDGNIQKCIENNSLIDLANKFQSIADIFHGLSELHSKAIWHLDVKPSNLLYFIEQQLTKIADFGSARQWVGENLDDDDKIEDLNSIFTTRLYAPPEILYNHQWTDDWNLYRRKIDLYLVGNVLVKFFTNLSFTALLRDEITEFDDWNNNQNLGKFSQILPSLMTASSEVYLTIKNEINEVNEECGMPLDKKEIEQIMLTIKQLCCPDPKLRGNPKELLRNNNNDGLYRYRDRFILLSKKAIYKSKKVYKLKERE